MEDARSRAGRTGRNSTEEAQREALVPEQISGPVPGRLWWELELGRAKPMGACAPAAGPRRQRSWALPCTMLLILLGSQLLVARGWSSQEKSVSDDQRVIESYLPATVEYALHVFNLKSKDVNAYRLVRIRKSWREQVGDHFSLPCFPARAYVRVRGGGPIKGSCSLSEVHNTQGKYNLVRYFSFYKSSKLEM